MFIQTYPETIIVIAVTSIFLIRNLFGNSDQVSGRIMYIAVWHNQVVQNLQESLASKGHLMTSSSGFLLQKRSLQSHSHRGMGAGFARSLRRAGSCGEPRESRRRASSLLASAARASTAGFSPGFRARGGGGGVWGRPGPPPPHRSPPRVWGGGGGGGGLGQPAAHPPPDLTAVSEQRKSLACVSRRIKTATRQQCSR